MRSSVLAMAIMGIAVSHTAAQSGCVEQKNFDEAVRTVRQQAQVDFPLRATRLPNLSDDVIFMKTGGQPTRHARVPLISFYSVTLSPYKLKGNEIESETVETDNHSEWLVAVDGESGHSYLLQGSENSIADFNNLIRTPGCPTSAAFTDVGLSGAAARRQPSGIGTADDQPRRAATCLDGLIATEGQVAHIWPPVSIQFSTRLGGQRYELRMRVGTNNGVTSEGRSSYPLQTASTLCP